MRFCGDFSRRCEPSDRRRSRPRTTSAGVTHPQSGDRLGATVLSTEASISETIENVSAVIRVDRRVTPSLRLTAPCRPSAGTAWPAVRGPVASRRPWPPGPSSPPPTWPERPQPWTSVALCAAASLSSSRPVVAPISGCHYWPGRWVRLTPVTLHWTGPLASRSPSSVQVAVAPGATLLTPFTPSATWLP